MGADRVTLATLAAASGEEIVPFDVYRAHKALFSALAEAREHNQLTPSFRLASLASCV